MHGKKIIIAEASSTLKNVADTLLRQHGYDVVCTSDGLQAWDVIQAERPDLAIIGLNLSGISGVELCRQMTGDQIAGGIPTLLFVGAKDDLSDDQISSTGARGYLKKPFSPKDLLDSVTRLIGPSGAEGAGQGVPSSTTAHTSYNAEILSTTSHLENSSNQVPTLNWMDIDEESSAPGTSPHKVASIDAASDDQELIIEEDQFGLISQHQNNRSGGVVDSPEPEEDEDYDWFIGEMKKEVEGSAGKAEPKAKKTESQEQEFPGYMSGNEVHFDDLGAGNPEKEARKEKPKKAARPGGNLSAKPISDGEIEKIADRVAQKLAASIASNIDRKALIAAIKSVMNS